MLSFTQITVLRNVRDYGNAAGRSHQTAGFKGAAGRSLKSLIKLGLVTEDGKTLTDAGRQAIDEMG